MAALREQLEQESTALKQENSQLVAQNAVLKRENEESVICLYINIYDLSNFRRFVFKPKDYFG